MTRWIIVSIVLGTAACGGPSDRAPQETLASVQQAAAISCKSYDGYTAALAEATIDCLGTIGPFDYASDATGGFLTPAFERCPAEEQNPPKDGVSALVRIKRLLSLQSGKRSDLAPLAVSCIRDAYLRASKELVGNGNTVCPTWHKVFAGGVPTKRNAALIVRRMPVPHFDEKQQKRIIDPPQRGSGFRFPKEYFFYTVDFSDRAAPPDQPCGRAENCARACSSLFEGFFVGRFGKYVVGDPYWWLDPTDYGGFDPFDDPYNRVNGFYHPMSLAGDDVPGEIYGDFGRAAFEDPFFADADGSAEECTRWDGSNHVMGRLIMDKLLDDPSTWMSRCDFYPTVPTL